MDCENFSNFMINTNNTDKKTFLVINLSFFGDVLLTNALCRNIKKNYPDSKIVFCVNKTFKEAAKYQDCVDDVICMDKRGKHSGFLGLIKFALSCPYRNKIDTAFIIYGNDRGILLSYFLGCKNRISGSKKITKYLLTDNFFDFEDCKNMQDINACFIKSLTGKKAEVLPIKYNPENTSDIFVDKLAHIYANKEIVALCATSKNKEKDMPPETGAQIIERLTNEGKTVFYVGAGKEARIFADNMKKLGCVNFVDLTNVTTINQLARVLKMCKGLISVDTGTMHLACALGVPVACVFYKTDTIDRWAPRDFLYKSVLIDRDYGAQYICDRFNSLF